MIDEEKLQEGSESSDVIISPQQQNNCIDLALVLTLNSDIAIAPYDPEQKVVNFGQGTAI